MTGTLCWFWRILIHHLNFVKVYLFYSTVAGVVPCGGRKSLPVHHHSVVQVISYFLWDHWAHPGYFENRITLRPALRGRGGGGGGWAYAALQTMVLQMKRLNQAEPPIFVILCVLYFQRQSFLTFITLPWKWKNSNYTFTHTRTHTHTHTHTCVFARARACVCAYLSLMVKYWASTMDSIYFPQNYQTCLIILEKIFQFQPILLIFFFFFFFTKKKKQSLLILRISWASIGSTWYHVPFIT